MIRIRRTVRRSTTTSTTTTSTTTAAIVGAAVVSAVIMGATPMAQAAPPPGAPGAPSGGLRSCGVKTDLATQSIYFGPRRTFAPSSYSGDLSRPDNQRFCNYNIGRGAQQFSANGLTFSIPSNRAGVNNAEMMSSAEFVRGRRSVARVDGSGIRGLNGTVGWGVATRTLQYPQLETAWFFYNDTDSQLGELTKQLRPIAAHIAGGLPKGFFAMVKSDRTLIPQVVPLDEKLLNGAHDYAVTLTDRGTIFHVDGKVVANFGVVLSNRVNLVGYATPAPLIFQTWIDSNYWFPYPIPQTNVAAHSYRIARYAEGPASSTPPVFAN